MTTPSVDRRPAPREDEDSHSFWEGTRRHELRGQKCAACQEVRFPPMPQCGHCGSPEWTEVFLSPNGVIYSWIQVNRALGTLNDDDVPCVFATVELPEGCRMVARIDDVEGVAIGKSVVAQFVDWTTWTEVRFALAPASAAFAPPRSDAS
jgi:uncharacterized OB-fold protein